MYKYVRARIGKTRYGRTSDEVSKHQKTIPEHYVDKVIS